LRKKITLSNSEKSRRKEVGCASCLALDLGWLQATEERTEGEEEVLVKGFQPSLGEEES